MSKERNASIMAQLDLVGAIIRSDTDAKLYEVTRAVYDLCRIAKALHKRYQNACSYQWADTDKYRKRTENLEQQAVELGNSIRVTVGLQTDPRGWPLEIVVAGGAYTQRLG